MSFLWCLLLDCLLVQSYNYNDEIIRRYQQFCIILVTSQTKRNLARKTHGSPLRKPSAAEPILSAPSDQYGRPPINPVKALTVIPFPSSSSSSRFPLTESDDGRWPACPSTAALRLRSPEEHAVDNVRRATPSSATFASRAWPFGGAARSWGCTPATRRPFGPRWRDAVDLRRLH
jgi:hypothetical protein